MRFTSESVMHDLEVALKERKELDWSNTDRLLLKAQLHIASLQRQLDHRELTDEEIDYCWSHSHGNTPWMKQKAFARAILRKAQE